MWVAFAVTILAVLGVTYALSADAAIPRKESGLQSFPVEASAQIYKGALVCTNTSGYLVAGADTNGYRFVGIAYENVLGTDQGVKSCRVHTSGVFKITATSITQAMVGKFMYLKDDATIDDTSTNFLCVGRLVEYVSTTSGWVDLGYRAVQLSDGPALLYRTIATGYTDVLGAIDYGDLTTNGASGGHIYGRGSWINLADSSVPGAGHIHVPWEGGIYDGGATLTNARLVFGAQYQAVLSGSPASLHCFRINTSHEITALFAAANAGSIHYGAGQTASSAVGTIALADIAGVGVVYVQVYETSS